MFSKFNIYRTVASFAVLNFFELLTGFKNVKVLIVLKVFKVLEVLKVLKAFIGWKDL